MSITAVYRRTQLSQEFFTTIFTDAFLFRDAPFQVLEGSGLSEEEKNFAIGIYNSSLYNEKNWDACAQVLWELGDVYHWQDNSEGPFVFCGKILYFLKIKKKDVAWFVSCLGRSGVASGIGSEDLV